MASAPKKFGAFSGVFTPSILTILGVIMYLRLGWVAGVAGLFGIVAIIFLAHVISFTTGLSISSIATDKKIKAGGIYYILSRSLGLPMGGSIGITLFVGTALSISMYIVGFTESFLSLPSIQHWLAEYGFQYSDMNTMRIIASVVLVLLVIIAFISTEIAIKTQFLILTAIALSLLSIFIGFFVHKEMQPAVNVLNYVPFKEFSFEVVFAVFFPAVTGFTAGVAMSGDLKDPKKDIPKGTMWAIITGFFVYLVLGISFVLFVDRDILLKNYNFLTKLAWIPALVIAGIWGATLSSALGGILGGPRIIQAVANDKIVPKFIGKGFGVNNEPRTALIITFIISEVGVLIGDLNIIAGIVTMFYLTAYGFINLAFSLEKWASTDFRPSFNVSVWIGIVGFVASFMIMFKLDMLSMFVAFIILAVLYYYIQQKRVNFKGSNVWQSVNISLVRSILNKLDKEKVDERNWRPNILLFSGGSNVRPHLIEFGKAIVAKQGIISNFEIIENNSAKILFPRHKLSLTDKDSETNEGIFTRRQECNDLYTGIETIASIYGFSGIEPNTVLLGWGRQTKDPVRFVEMLRRLSALDLNIILLDYDKERGFGNYDMIDVWWRGGSNNGNLMLALIKFMKSTFEWRNAKVRIMIVNPVNDNKPLIERDAYQVLSNIRLDAEIRVINNEIDNRPIYDIIKQESVNSDLIFLGIPEIEENKEKDYIETVDKFCKEVGTTVLIKASSLFKELHIGIRPGIFNAKQKKPADENVSKRKLPVLIKPVPTIVAVEIERTYEQTISVVDKFLENDLDPIFVSWKILYDNVEDILRNYYETIHKKIKRQEGDLRRFIINQNLQLVARIRKLVREFQKSDAPLLKEKVDNLIKNNIELKRNVSAIIPDKLVVEFSNGEKKMLEKAGKLNDKEKKLLKKTNKFKIGLKNVKEELILPALSHAWLEMLKELDYRTFLLEQKFNRLLTLIEQYHPGKYYSNLDYKKVLDVLTKKEESFNEILNQLKKESRQNREIINELVKGEIIRTFNKTSILIETPLGNKKLNKVKIKRKQIRKDERLFSKYALVWDENRKLMSNVTYATFHLLSFKLRLRSLMNDNVMQLKSLYAKLDNNILGKLIYYFDNYKNQLLNSKKIIQFSETDIATQDFVADVSLLLEGNNKTLGGLLRGFPNKLELFSEEKYNNFKEFEFDKNATIEVKFSLLVNFIIQNDLMEPLRKLLNKAAKNLDEKSKTAYGYFNQLKVSSVSNEKKNYHDILNLIDEFVGKLNIEKKNIIEQQQNIELALNERLNTVWDKLNISTFTIQNELLQSYIKEHRDEGRKNLLINTFTKIKKLYDKKVVEFWYKKKSNGLLANELEKEDKEQDSKNIKLFTNRITPSIEYLEKLPFYYRQLFLQKEFYLNDFWVNREKEINKALEVVSHHFDTNKKAALLVTGEFNSGKSFFVQHLTSLVNENRDVYILQNAPGGSYKINILHNQLEKASLIYKNTDEILGSIAKSNSSVVIIEDLELWWVRSNNVENSAIKEIIRWVKLYGDRILFVLTANIYSYKVLNSIFLLDGLICETITLGPMDPVNLAEVIIKRHNSANYKVKMNGKILEQTIYSRDFAKLMISYSTFSKGYPGNLLQFWINNIITIHENIVEVRMPLLPDIGRLEKMDIQTLLALLQFALHKQMTVEKFAKCMLIQRENAQETLEILERFEIINSDIPGVYKLNNYLRPFIIEILKEKQLL
jgi:amino acid transporter